MKKIIFIMSMILVSFNLSAQEKETTTELNKNKKVSFEVNGVCGMCKAKIEKAAIQTKGVKYANWDMGTHQLSLIMDERKTSEMKIKEAIADVGYESEGVMASEDAYNNLAACCKYKEENIKEHHDMLIED